MDPRTILVVEDDDVTRAGFGAILRQRGHRVWLSSGGREALEHLRTSEFPDLIILDMLMRDMDGWHFLKARQPSLESVPFLIVTGIDAASDQWAASLGASDWLRKPISTTALLEKVDKCLRVPA